MVQESLVRESLAVESSEGTGSAGWAWARCNRRLANPPYTSGRCRLVLRTRPRNLVRKASRTSCPSSPSRRLHTSRHQGIPHENNSLGTPWAAASFPGSRARCNRCPSSRPCILGKCRRFCCTRESNGARKACHTSFPSNPGCKRWCKSRPPHNPRGSNALGTSARLWLFEASARLWVLQSSGGLLLEEVHYNRTHANHPRKLGNDRPACTRRGNGARMVYCTQSPCSPSRNRCCRRRPWGSARRGSGTPGTRAVA